MNLAGTQIKDTYGNLLTIGSVAGTPTTGTLQNGAGSDLTSITLNGAAVFNEGGGNFDFRVEGDTETHLLFVDASADRIGIGTSAPSIGLVEIGASSASILAVISDGTNGSALRWGGGGAGATNLRFLGPGNVEYMRIEAASNRLYVGAKESATPVTAQLETTSGSGTDINGAQLRIKGGASTGSGSGGVITFETSSPGASGTTVRLQTERMRVTSDGNIKIGGTANRATTEGSAQLVLFNGTAPVGTLANGVSFYSASGEANVMDAAGNATLLSPHDKDTNEWIFRSKHTPTGKVLKIDVERMLRFINDHFGLDMIEEFTEAQ